MLSLKELLKLRDIIDDCDMDTTNKISRNIIRAYKREKGECWMGKINQYYSFEGLKFYKKGMVYNFGCDFVVPYQDDKLESLLLKHYNNKDLSKVKNHIHDIITRVEEIGGILLYWR